jgi:hypothetical protein
MIRRCVEKLLLACQTIASTKAGALNRNRENYRCCGKMPNECQMANIFSQDASLCARAVVSAGRGLPALPARAMCGAVEAVASTAFLERIVQGVCVRRRGVSH